MGTYQVMVQLITNVKSKSHFISLEAEPLAISILLLYEQISRKAFKIDCSLQSPFHGHGGVAFCGVWVLWY
jgi:hypothetical protein